MNLATIARLRELALAYDTETYRIQPGLSAPPLVCASIAVPAPGGIALEGELLTKADGFDALRAGLADRVLVGANIAFDLMVGAVHGAKLGVDIMPEIFAALFDGRVYDIQLAEALDAIAEGCLGKDPRTGGELINPETGRRGRYSLSICVDLVLGRTDAKANDEWRLRYGELDRVPMADWPLVARTYPVDDAKNTLEVALAQAGIMPRAGAHRWGSGRTCEWCGLDPKQVYVDGIYQPCRTRRRSRNLHNLAAQVGPAFVMAAGAAWGFRVDQHYVDVIEHHALEGRADAERPFVEAGLLKANRDGSTSKDMAAISRRVAIAYGANPTVHCGACHGTGKVRSPKAKPVRCRVCTGYCIADKATPKALEWRVANPNGCATCQSTGLVPDPKALINCTDCGATGLDLSVAKIPRTETERIGTGRDTLHESGDELLMDLADLLEGAKTLDVYVPYWRKARVPIAGHAEGCDLTEAGKGKKKRTCRCSGPYRDVPLTLWPNSLLETGRASYSEVIQLLPRKPGFFAKNPDGSPGPWIPSLRECVVARPGYVLSSEDYEAGELITHAQSLIWIVGEGESRLAEALVSGIKVHNALGAQMLGISYEEFQRRQKEKMCVDARQAGKPGNFGFPGGMGAVRMVQTQRKQGPDTPHPSGPSWVKDDAGNPVRGYKGLRFCILMDNAPRCGEEMVTSWEQREGEVKQIAPTCKRCIECAIRLKQAWRGSWPEHKDYFKFVTECLNHGQLITEAHMELWPWLRGTVPLGRLAPGEIMQHHSGRIRGGTDYNSAANGFFQGLLADAAKAALLQIGRECFDRTARVPDMLHPNSVRSAYAGGPSPLLGSRPILFAHDENLCEHPESVAHDAATRVSEIMVDELRWHCPDLAPACKAEPTLMRRWFKGAKPRFLRGGDKPADASDRLVPWEPDPRMVA